jgi:hypothetical protein
MEKFPLYPESNQDSVKTRLIEAQREAFRFLPAWRLFDLNVTEKYFKSCLDVLPHDLQEALEKELVQHQASLLLEKSIDVEKMLNDLHQESAS